MATSHHRVLVRFGLRTVLATVFICALACGWLAALMSEGRRHEQLAAQFASLGCDVEFSHMEWVSVTTAPPNAGLGVPVERKSTLPALLETTGGAKAVRRLTSVTIRAKSDIPAALKLLTSVKQIETLSFYSSGVAESQLASLLGEVDVRQLHIPSEKLSRKRLPWLSHHGLTWLCVARTQFSNPAISDLPVSLEYLDATRTRIDDRGLGGFVRLRNLRTLRLHRTPTTKAGIDELRTKMPWCEVMWEPLTVHDADPGVTLNAFDLLKPNKLDVAGRTSAAPLNRT